MAHICPLCARKMDDTEDYCLCYAGRSGQDGRYGADLIGGRYVMISTIKSGAMGCVFKAYDTRLGIHVAVKKMISRLIAPGEIEYSEKRFREEATILSSLHHGGLPGVIDFFTVRDASSGEAAHYLVMSFIKGRDLESLLEERDHKPFPVEEALDIFRQIADILTYLHEHNPPIVYRDLKPSNIMLQNGKVVLVDFGIAKLFTPLQKGTMIGTPGYAAPEQYQGFAEPRSDIFGFGAVMHYLLTGINPEDKTGSAFRFDSVKERNQEVPDYIDTLIMSMLEISMDRRPGSASQVSGMLVGKRQGSAEAPLPSSHGGATARSLPRRKGSSRRNLFVAAILIVVLSIAAFIYYQNSASHITVCYDSDARSNPAGDDMPEFEEKADTESGKGDLKTVEEMISRGAPVYGKDKSTGRTLLHYAVEDGDLEMAGLLIRHGAAVNAVDKKGFSPLYLAILGQHPGMVRLLLQKGADINYVKGRPSGITLLHVAASKADPYIINLLICHGSDVNAKNELGLTPLHFACSMGSLQGMKMLVETGADLHCKDLRGKTLLDETCRRKNTEIAEYLFSKGLTVKKDVDQSIIFELLDDESLPFLELLISRGLDVNQKRPSEKKNGQMETPLQLALNWAHVNTVKLLAEHGAEARNAFEASAIGDCRQLSRFLDRDATLVRKTDDNGNVPLHWAAYWGEIKTSELLLARGSVIDTRNKNRKTPLHIAVMGRHPEMVAFLLKKGANVRAKDMAGETPVKLSTDEEITRLLNAEMERTK